MSEKEELLRKEVKSKVIGMFKDFSLFSNEEISKAMDDAFHVSEFDAISLNKFQDDFCNKCGKCCKICDPIVLSEKDIIQIPKYLGFPVSEMRKKYNITPIKGKHQQYNLKAHPCPFQSWDNVCFIYAVRPFVCRSFPAGFVLSQIIMNNNSSIELPHYCEVIKKQLAYQTFGYLMQNKMPKEVKEKLQKFVNQKFSGLDKINDPVERLKVMKNIQDNLYKEKSF